MKKQFLKRIALGALTASLLFSYLPNYSYAMDADETGIETVVNEETADIHDEHDHEGHNHEEHAEYIQDVEVDAKENDHEGHIHETETEEAFVENNASTENTTEESVIEEKDEEESFVEENKSEDNREVDLEENASEECEFQEVEPSAEEFYGSYSEAQLYFGNYDNILGYCNKAKRDHEWEDTYVIQKSATKSEDGYMKLYCNNCKKLLKTYTLPKSITSESTPTYQSYGYMSYSCSAYEGYGMSVETPSQTICQHPSASVQMELISEATCNSYSVYKKSCGECGEILDSRYVDMASGYADHVYSVTSSAAPSYQADGYVVYTCIICSHSYTEVKPKLVCAHPSNKVNKILVEEATCSSYAVYKEICSVCGQVIRNNYEDSASGYGNHVYSSTEVKRDADNNRYYEAVCYVCGNVNKEQSYVAHEHHYVVTGYTPATCSASGSIEKECELCGEKTTSSVAKLIHDWSGDYVIEKEATCTETGVKKLYCPKCNEVIRTLSISTTPHTYKWVVVKEASETEEGLKEYKCSVCGNVDKNETISKNASNCLHPNKYYQLTKKANCIEKAKYTVICRDCGEIVSTNTTRSTDSFDHNNHISFVEASRVNATVKSEGTILYVCQGCSYSYTETIPKLECRHTSTTKKEENGVGYIVCKTCGKKLGTYDIQAECSHNYGSEYVQRIIANETTWGETDRCCAKCGKVLSTEKVHPYKAYTVVDEQGVTQTLYGWFDYNYSHQVAKLTNKYRQENGTTTLSYNESLQYASDIRALEAAVYWAHTRPNGARWNTIDTKWTYGGENLASGHTSPEDVMVGWKNSPGHNRNLLFGTQTGDTPYRGISVSCFHRYTFSEVIPGKVYETLVWSQHFTFYAY